MVGMFAARVSNSYMPNCRELLCHIQLGTLVGLLLDAGRLDDARRVSEDAAYRDEMLAEFGLKASE